MYRSAPRAPGPRLRAATEEGKEEEDKTAQQRPSSAEGQKTNKALSAVCGPPTWPRAPPPHAAPRGPAGPAPCRLPCGLPGRQDPTPPRGTPLGPEQAGWSEDVYSKLMPGARSPERAHPDGPGPARLEQLELGPLAHGPRHTG